MQTSAVSLGTQTTSQADGLPVDTIVGTPYQDVQEWDGQQTAQDDCAIRSEQFIIEQYTGQKLSELSLEQEAQANGWYHPGQGGTPIADMSMLLQAHGIAANSYTHATIQQLAGQLESGHKVIAAVNAEDLWQHDPSLHGQSQAPSSQSPDHAVVVSGIDTTDPNNPMVLISDPGTGEALASYSLSDFMKAWNTSGDTMVATDKPESGQASTPHTTVPAHTVTPTAAPVPEDRQHQYTPSTVPGNESAPPAPAEHPAQPAEPPASDPYYPFDTQQAPGAEPMFVEIFAVPFSPEMYSESPYMQFEYAQAEEAFYAEYHEAPTYMPTEDAYSQTGW